MESILLGIFIVIVVFMVITYIFPIAQVTGNSMYPTYTHGEILLSSRIFSRSKIKVGNVLLFKREGRVIIKRVSEIKMENKKLYLYFLGDNLNESYDSREYGWVDSKYLVAKVFAQRPKNI